MFPGGVYDHFVVYAVIRNEKPVGRQQRWHSKRSARSVRQEKVNYIGGGEVRNSQKDENVFVFTLAILRIELYLSLVAD